jgi:hypothetical protein
MSIAEIQAIRGLIEFSRLDVLVETLILYYLFKVCNMAVITGGNMGEALAKNWKAWRDEK